MKARTHAIKLKDGLLDELIVVINYWSAHLLTIHPSAAGSSNDYDYDYDYHHCYYDYSSHVMSYHIISNTEKEKTPLMMMIVMHR